MAVIEQKIAFLDEQIDSISSDMAVKDLFEMQLESLKKEIEMSSSLTINDIKWQIKILEEKINSWQSSEDEVE